MVLRQALPAFFCALLLTGCGSSGPGTPTHPPTINSQPSGSVHGGQQPVAGATIQLYTVGTSADGSAATPLLTSTVTSDSTGSFSITGLYSCTSATQVYIVATGGNPGLASANPNIALMAALGPCSSLTPSTFISINELTTVAAVAALAPYMSSAAAIGSSPSDATQLANAFTLANEYVNTTTGTSPGNASSAVTVPTAELNTLADILSACINSTGGAAGDGSLCGNLFSLTTVVPSPAPTNTIQAMLNLANNPTLNTSALYALTPPTPPFQPTLTSAPTDFSLNLQGSSIPQVTPAPINFLNVPVGTFSPVQTITIQLTSSTNLGNIYLVGDTTDLSLADTVPVQTGYCANGTGGGGSSCWTQIEARPSTAGLHTATLAVDYNGGASTVYIPVSVTGIASNPSSFLSNTFVDFPPTITATSSTPVPVTVNNTGPGTLTVSAVALTGADNNFTQTNNCSSVAPNANCTIYVTFSPTNSGVQSATLQVTTVESGSNTVALSGLSLALGTPASLWPSNLTYTVWGANEDLTLLNPGTTSLSLTSPGAGDTGGSGDLHSYSISSNGCTTTLAPGQACTFSVQNVLMMNLSASPLQPPPSSVTGQASNQFTSNIISGGNAILLQNGSQFSGNSAVGNMSFPSTSVGSSSSTTIELANINTQIVSGQPQASIGGSPAASLAIGGANPGDFTVSAVTSSVSSAPASFCPGGTAPCNITITFTPTATGTRTAKISLDSNGVSTGQYIYVTGTAIGPGPHFNVSSSSISLTSYYPVSSNPNSVGSTQLTLTNVGTTTIDLATSFTGANPTDMSANVGNCSSVAPQATCTFSVAFSGPAVGNYSANLVLSDANSTFSVSIPITALTGYWPPLVSPSVLSFGNQPVGSASTKQYFRVMDGEVAVNHPISVSLESGSNFTLPDGSTCPASSDETCSLSVAFAPQAAGSDTEYLTVTDTIDNLQTQVQLTGTGVSPDYTLSAYSVAFPAQTVGTSSTTTVTLTNVSTHTINVSGISVTGATDGNFTETNNCSTIAINGTCAINITFVPIAGMQSAYISITSNAANSVPGINVTGTGQ